MADTLDFELVSPERLVKSEPVEMVVVPCAEGDVGVLPGHAPLIATIRPGLIDIHEGGKIKESIFVGGGFAEVSDNRCIVLAEEAVPIDGFTRADAEERLREAREATDAATGEEIEEARKHLTLSEELLAAIEYVERRSRR